MKKLISIEKPPFSPFVARNKHREKMPCELLNWGESPHIYIVIQGGWMGASYGPIWLVICKEA